MSEWKPTNNPKDALGTAKAPLHLIPNTALVAASMAFLEGREKYGQYNWRVTGVRASVYQAALLRHMTAWFDGEDIDPDSGLPHLWKAIACLAILIDAQELAVLEDDRPPIAPTAEMMARTKEMGEAIRDRLAGYDPFQYTERNRDHGPQEDPGPRNTAPHPDGQEAANAFARARIKPASGPAQGGVKVRHEETREAYIKRLKREALEAIEEAEARYRENPVPTEVRCPQCRKVMSFVDEVPNQRDVHDYRCPDHGTFPVVIGVRS